MMGRRRLSSEVIEHVALASMVLRAVPSGVVDCRAVELPKLPDPIRQVDGHHLRTPSMIREATKSSAICRALH
jgi:hypothetical protein